MSNDGKNPTQNRRVIRGLGNIPVSAIASAFVESSVRLMEDVTRFSLGGEDVSARDLGNPSCLLPVIVWHADALRTWVDGRGFGIEYPQSEDAFLSVTADLSSVTDSQSELILYLAESLHDAKLLPVDERNCVMLDALVHRFVDSIALRAKNIANSKNVAKSEYQFSI
jgi:hypothetical protein